MTKHRSRCDVDRMIHRRSKRLGDNWHELGVLPWSIDPTLANLLWQDLRARGYEFQIYESQYCVNINSKDLATGLLIGEMLQHGRNGERAWTWMDLIARLWLEVTSLERNK